MESLKNDKTWIVKSSTRIMGPYSPNDIFQLLKEKQISSLDEARKPAGRWTYIREHKELAELVERLKVIDESNELTVSQMTLSQTASKAENADEEKDYDEKTVKITNPFPSEDLIKDIVPIKEATVAYNSTKPTNVTYGAYTKDQIDEAAEDKARPWKFILISLVAIAVLGYGGYFLFTKSRQSQGYQSLIATALRLNSLQLYEKAYQTYKKAKSQKDPELAVQAQMAVLAITLENETNVSRKVIEKYLLADEIKDRRMIVDLNIAVGLSYLREGDENKAMETFQKAASYEPFNQAVLLNRSLLYLRKGEYRDSYFNLKKVNSKDELASLLLYVRAYTLVEMLQSTSVIMDEIRELAIEIPNQIQKSALLRNELLFLNIKLQSTLRDEGAMSAAVDRYLETLPAASAQIVKDPRIDWKMTSWETLDRICVELSRLRPGFKAKLLRAHCLLENQNSTQAQKWIEEARAESPNDPYVINTQVYWMDQVNRDSEIILLAKQNENILFPSSVGIWADVCLTNKDESCALVQLNKAVSNTYTAPKAYLGLAQIAAQKGQAMEALQKIKQGLGVEPLFKSLIELRESLESQ